MQASKRVPLSGDWSMRMEIGLSPVPPEGERKYRHYVSRNFAAQGLRRRAPAGGYPQENSKVEWIST